MTGEFLLWKERLPVLCDLYFWPEGRSFTGQMSVELHLPGCQPILDAVVSAVCQNGCRLAGPGEFTLRAFLSGRITLPQAEAVLGVIDAQNNQELTLALKQLAGGIGVPLAEIRENLLELICHLEAEFDFAEEDIEFIDRHVLKSKIRESLEFLQRISHQLQGRNHTQSLPRVVLTGVSNVGKSSLFNRLGKAAKISDTAPLQAIVSDFPGTTRDYLEVDCRWQDISFCLVDTAGIDSDVGSITGTPLTDENETPAMLAQAKTRESLETADCLLMCQEWNGTVADFPLPFEKYADRMLKVFTKADDSCDVRDNNELFTSSLTGAGIEKLLTAISTFLKRNRGSCEILPSTAQRCREALNVAAEALERASVTNDELLIAADLRLAFEQLGLVTGAACHEKILDGIFSRFCIGK
jgi:tRNA modification GTPase